jgi:hypothetical protein
MRGATAGFVAPPRRALPTTTCAVALKPPGKHGIRDAMAPTRLARSALVLGLFAAPAAAETTFTVDPTAGRNQFTAVFDATVGERIVAVSSRVACTIAVDEATRAGSARCSVPLTSIRVDAHETKTEHFRQWATNKKGDPAACRLEAVVGPLAVPPPAEAGRPVVMETTAAFTVCGRARDDGGAEAVRITVAEVAPRRAGEPRLLRIRAHVAAFDRERYRVGPRHTPGWVARVEELADVVAPTGTIDVSLFATAPAE